MNLQRKFHEEHKARQLRLGMIKAPVVRTTVVAAPVAIAAPVMVPVEPANVQKPTPWAYRYRLVYNSPIGPLRDPMGVVPKETDADKSRRIKMWMCSVYHVSRTDIESARRTKVYVEARQEAMWHISKVANWSTVRIGRFFGDRDHTTVIHAVRRVQERFNTLSRQKADALSPAEFAFLTRAYQTLATVD